MTDRLGHLMLGVVLCVALMFSGYVAGALLERARCQRTPDVCARASRAVDAPAALPASNPMRPTRASAPAWLP